MISYHYGYGENVERPPMGTYNSNPDHQSAPRSPSRMCPSDSNALMRTYQARPEEIDSENEDYYGDTIDLNNEPKRRASPRPSYHGRARSFHSQQRFYPRPKARSYSYDDRSHYSGSGYSDNRPHYIYENVDHIRLGGRSKTEEFNYIRRRGDPDRDEVLREIRQMRMSLQHDGMMDGSESRSRRNDRTCCIAVDRVAHNWIERRRRHSKTLEMEQIERDLAETIAELDEWSSNYPRGRRR
jgi:hypothetical protein